MGFYRIRLLICCLIYVSATCYGAPPGGQGESSDHGAHSPHEKRQHQQNHYKQGEHDPDFDHEAVLGSRKEAESYDELSPEESKRRLRILAKKMDSNKDDNVSKDELTDWIEKSMKTLDQEELDERYNEIDANTDKKVSWDEYKKESFGDDEDNEPMDAEDKQLLEEDQRYFNAADKDKDGFLDRAEFAAFQNPEAFDYMHDSLVENTMRDKDTDKNGKLSLQEFLGDTTDKEWVESETTRFKNEFDKDGDGALDRQEMKAWLIPSVRQTAVDEVKHLFKEANKPEDATGMTIDEVVDHHDVFVGSEATNYGEHLEKISHDEF